MGILSLFLSWLHPGAFNALEVPVEFTMNVDVPDPMVFSFSVSIFIVGTLIAFISPLGCFFQGTGIMGFVHGASVSEDISVGIGTIVGLISFIIVLSSFIVPLATGYKMKMMKYMTQRASMLNFGLHVPGTKLEKGNAKIVLSKLLSMNRDEKSDKEEGYKVICSKCGKEMPIELKLCDNCHARLLIEKTEKTCPFCGYDTSIVTPYCDWCNKDLRKPVKCRSCGGVKPKDEDICPHCGFDRLNQLRPYDPNSKAAICPSCKRFVEKRHTNCHYCLVEFN